MVEGEQISAQLLAAIGGVRRGRAAADRLCWSLTHALGVDGAAVTVDTAADGAVGKSLGGSGPLSDELVELQFMLGEGPSLVAVKSFTAVLAADLHGRAAAEWPNFAGAASALGVGALFVFPVAVGGLPVGTLSLHRHRPGPLGVAALAGAYFAAELAVLPILDVAGMDMELATEDGSSAEWAELTALTRSEVYQAAGVLIAQLGVTATEALVRLRAHAFAHGKTTSQTAYDILEHRAQLGDGTDRPAEPEDQQ